MRHTQVTPVFHETEFEMNSEYVMGTKRLSVSINRIKVIIAAGSLAKRVEKYKNKGRI